MSKSIQELFPKKSKAQPRVYAYSLDKLETHEGLLKVGQTSRKTKTRVKEQTETVGVEYTIHVDELAVKEDGDFFSDHEVRRILTKKGFENPFGEWMKCKKEDVLTAINELRMGEKIGGTHHLSFKMRKEQVEAVNQTQEYFQSIWQDDNAAAPRFLWNAKMRFGKTFTAYQLAKKILAKRVLVVTFKPAVADSWKSDLESHVDFNGWQFLSRNSKQDPTDFGNNDIVVYFGSFQDLLGKDKVGNIKAKNEWIHKENWDLVIFDEYHFGAWRETAKELFEGEDNEVAKEEIKIEFASDLKYVNEDLETLSSHETEFLPIQTRAYLYLSGTPFRALATGEFVEEQIFNWTYTDEQRAKLDFEKDNPDEFNPYGALPEMRLFTYRMPDEILSVAHQGEFDEFDLNTFFSASGTDENATFKHESDVQKWLDIIRASYLPKNIESMRAGETPPLPYSDVRLLPYLNHSFWFLPDVASCFAMANLLKSKHNIYWHDFEIIVCAGQSAGIGINSLPPVRKAIGDGFNSKSITLSCGKLTTGVTVRQWSSILMLRNLKSPETYFQAAFRVQSPWVISNPDGDDPNSQEILKPVCFVFDFAPTRALRQVSEYGIRLSRKDPNKDSNPETALKELVSFLPILAYDGANMSQLDAGSILDIAMAGTSANLLARKWQSSLLVNVDNDTLSRVLDNAEALEALENIEGWRNLGDNVLESIINSSRTVKKLKKKAKKKPLSSSERKHLTEEEREYRSKRKRVQDKLKKFATRIPAFMYLTDFRENTLQDVITKLEPDLFHTVTGLTIDDFNLLVSLRVFNTELMNEAVFSFRRYEDSSLSYTGIQSHENLSSYGLFDTVVAKNHD